MTQNAEVFRPLASHIKNKKFIPGETTGSTKKWCQDVTTHSWSCSCNHKLLSPYLTIHLRNLPPASSAGLDLHECSLPTDPVILKPKKPKFCAGEIKTKLDLLLLILNGYYLQRSPSFKRKVTLLYHGIHIKQNTIYSYSSIVSQSSHPPLLISSTTVLRVAAAKLPYNPKGICYLRHFLFHA